MIQAPSLFFNIYLPRLLLGGRYFKNSEVLVRGDSATDTGLFPLRDFVVVIIKMK